MTHLDLFSGIGGFSLASERVWPDIKHVFCEIDPFCQAVLKKHWPTSKIYGDIRTITNTGGSKSGGLSGNEREEVSPFRGCDLLTGGFPCQPFSHAGRRKGTADDRHLWPEMRRVIQELSPRWVVGENVRGLLSIEGGMVFESVCTDLEALGYEVQPFVIPACAINAPHRRDRVWIVARHTEHNGCDGSKNNESRGTRGDGDSQRTDEVRQSTGSALSRDQDAPNTEGVRRRQGSPITGGTRQRTGKEEERRGSSDRGGWSEPWPTVATRLCALDDGISDGLVRPRGWRNAALKAAGNAIVPQVAEEIFNAIREYELTP